MIHTCKIINIDKIFQERKGDNRTEQKIIFFKREMIQRCKIVNKYIDKISRKERRQQN